MTKLNKEQLKKLYDYGGTLSPKDWANLIDSIPDDSEIPKYDDSGTVIETTYEEAEALYESGNMIPGVKYEFEYKHHVIMHNINEDTSNSITTGIKNEFPIQVYIDRSGQLKAIGSYTLDSYITIIRRNFVADFRFENIALIDIDNNILYENIQSDITNYIDIPEYNDSAINTLTSFLTNNNIFYSVETYEDEMLGIMIKRFAYTLSKGFHVYIQTNEETDSAIEYLCLPNGKCIRIDHDYDSSIWINNEYVTVSHMGLHNIDFGTFKHSHITEGYFYNSANEDYVNPSIVEANVHNDIYIPFAAYVEISHGDIINTSITYAIPEEMYSDDPACYIINNIYTNNNDIELVFNTNDSVVDIPSLIMNTLDENNPYKFAYGDHIVVDKPVDE